MNTNQIIEIITTQIETDHMLEKQVSANKHLPVVNYVIDRVETKTLDKNKLKITYGYRIINKTDLTLSNDYSSYEICYERNLIV